MKFTTSLLRADYEELVRAANLAQRSLLAEASVRLVSTLGERDGRGAPGVVDSAGGAVPSRSPSASGGTGGGVVPVRAVAAVAPRSPSGVCPHGFSLAECLDPVCKAARRR